MYNVPYKTKFLSILNQRQCFFSTSGLIIEKKKLKIKYHCKIKTSKNKITNDKIMRIFCVRVHIMVQ